jgi:hypothetical protein
MRTGPCRAFRQHTIRGAIMCAGVIGLHAQDTRSVTEPVFPPVCAQLTAQLSAGPSAYNPAQGRHAAGGCRCDGVCVAQSARLRRRLNPLLRHSRHHQHRLCPMLRITTARRTTR